MKMRTLYTEYVGSNPKDKKDIDYARVLATDRKFGKKNKMGFHTWCAVAVVLPTERDKWITDWYTAEDNYLTARGIK